MTTHTQTTDLIHAITTDHRNVERAFAELERGSTSPDYRKELADHVIADLVRHSVAEEQFLYPTARDHIDGGGEMVDEELAGHAEAEQVMKQLEGIAATDPRFDRLLSQLIGDVRHHIDEEESTLLPKLQSSCSPEALRDLGHKWLLAKQAAPTRPHPSTPDTPPANLVVDTGVGMIDKIRDALSNREV